MCLFLTLSFLELISYSICQHLVAYLLPKAPIHPTSSNPSIPHFVYSFSFLGAVSFQRQFAMFWFCCQMCCFKLYIFLLTGSTTNIRGDWVSNATSPNPKKTYETKRKTPSAGDINHSMRT